MELLSDLILGISSLLTMPGSTLFIVAVAIAINLLTIYATLRLVDIEEMKAINQVVAQWREKANRARLNNDPILLEEVMAEQGRILALSGKAASMRMKPMCYTYIPIIIVFFALSSFYGAIPVAILPFNVHKLIPALSGWIGVQIPGVGFGLYFWTFYFLASVALGSPLRKLFNADIPMK